MFAFKMESKTNGQIVGFVFMDCESGVCWLILLLCKRIQLNVNLDFISFRWHFFCIELTLSFSFLCYNIQMVNFDSLQSKYLYCIFNCTHFPLVSSNSSIFPLFIRVNHFIFALCIYFVNAFKCDQKFMQYLTTMQNFIIKTNCNFRGKKPKTVSIEHQRIKMIIDVFELELLRKEHYHKLFHHLLTHSLTVSEFYYSLWYATEIAVFIYLWLTLA